MAHNEEDDDPIALLNDALRALVDGFEDMLTDLNRMLDAPRRRRREARADLGNWLGLKDVKSGNVHMTGYFNELAVRLTSRQNDDAGWRTTCQVRLTEPLPAAFGIHKPTSFTDLFMPNRTRPKLVGPHAALPYLLGGADRRKQVWSIHRSGNIVFKGDLIEAHTRQEMTHNAQWARAVLDLAYFLNWRWKQRGDEMKRLGLVLEGDRWTGEVDGVVVWVDEMVKRAQYQCGVTAAIDPALPPNTEVLIRQQGQKARTVGDIFLDTLLAFKTSDSDALAQRLARESVRAPLLEIVHGNPGSAVDSRWIRLWTGNSICGLTPKIELVAELANALRV